VVEFCERNRISLERVRKKLSFNGRVACEKRTAHSANFQLTKGITVGLSCFNQREFAVFTRSYANYTKLRKNDGTELVCNDNDNY
jgi:hypothetical protein